MKKKKLVFLILELLCVVLVVGGIFFVASNMVKLTPVYVFNSNLSVGEVVSVRDITVKEIPQKAINESFVRSKDEIVGKMVVSKVKKGDYILQNLLIKSDSTSALETADLSKMRKVSFPVRMDSALAGNLEKGDVVDLLYIGKHNSSLTGEEFTYSKIFLQGIYIWGVSTSDGYAYNPKDGSFNDGPESFSGEQKVDMGDNSTTGGDNGELSIVTVAVTASQAEEISARANSGQIQIIGRFSNGDDVPSTGFVINGNGGVYAGHENPEGR